MTTLRDDLSRLAEEAEGREKEMRRLYETCRDGDGYSQVTARAARHYEKIHRDHASALRSLLAAHPESAPAPGIRCPCGGGTLVPVPTCPACGEQWIGRAEAIALDTATEPHVIEARRAARKAAPAPQGRSCAHAYSPDTCALDAPAPAPQDGPDLEALRAVLDAADSLYDAMQGVHLPFKGEAWMRLLDLGAALRRARGER